MHRGDSFVRRRTSSLFTSVLLCLFLTSGFGLGGKFHGCRPKCSRNEYELVPCTEAMDRKCRDLNTLPKPSLSPNLICEDRREVKPVVSHPIAQDSTINLVANTVHLKRGSGLSVQVTLKELNLSPLFRPVDHTMSNDDEAFQGDSKIMSEFCPNPLPDKYQLMLILHQGVTTKAHRSASCNVSIDETLAILGVGGVGGAGGGAGGGGVVCPEEPGFTLSPRESCQTYSVFGRLPALDPNNRSVLCVKPGRLTDQFEVSDDLRQISSMSVDKSVKCAEQRASCDSCSIMCARHMQGYQGSHRCNITADDADNGQSPRLQLCFTCCTIQDCSKACQVYQSRDCQTVRCVTGNVAEFVLTPIFPPAESRLFACHVELLKGYKVYDVEYSVIYRGDVINDAKLSASRLQDFGLPHRKSDIHNFLLIHYGSEVTASPDQLEGNAATGKFTVGYYQATGTGMSQTGIGSKVLYLRPRRPFAVGSSLWRKQDCDTDLLSEFNTLPDSLSHADAYRQENNIDVEFVSKFTYRLINRTQPRPPFVYFEIAKDQSILRPLFPPTTIRDDESLKTDLRRKEHEWVLRVQGQLMACPGSFELVVSDALYPSQPLFHFDFGVGCPEKFNVSCVIPTEGPDVHDKTLLVDLIDSYRTIKMTIYRPSSQNVTMTTTYKGDPPTNPRDVGVTREAQMTVFTPTVALLCILIAIFGLLLFIGVVTDLGSKWVQRRDVVLHSKRLLFVVCYVTFRATYSIVVTFTVLVLLLRHVNRDSMSVLREFPTFVRSVEVNQTQQLDRIQTFASDEILRQNRLANDTKGSCELKLGQLQTLLEQMKQRLRESSHDDRIVSQVALQYTKLMIINLTDSIKKFKQEFASYANKSLDRLVKTMKKTSTSIQSNKWLAGALVIYDAVKSKRTAQGRETKPFVDWAGIRHDVNKLALDLSLNDFPMPNVTDFINIQLPKTTAESISRSNTTEDVVLPRNQWYYQYEKKPVASVWSGAKSDKELLKVKVMDIMNWTTLMIVLVAIDVIWFIHRMARTYATAKALLYGRSTYLECHQVTSDMHLRRVSPHGSQASRCLQFAKDLNFRIMRTDFVPKVVASVTICCAIYVILMVFERLLTIRTLSSIGYFDALMAPVETSYQLAITRIRTNAFRIRKFELPFYEELVNLRAKRYQLMADMYAEVQRSNAILRSSEYCAWKRVLEPGEPCHCQKISAEKLKFDGCELKPVLPHIHHRHDFTNSRELFSNAIAPFIDASRHLVTDSCHMAVVFLGVIILIDLLDTVMWLYLQRFNILRPKAFVDIDSGLT